MSHTIALNPKFLAGVAASLEVTPPAIDAELVAALAANDPFPFRQIEFGRMAAKADRDLKFGGDGRQVTFKAGASAFAGIGVYLDGPALVKGLGVDDHVSSALDLATSDEDLFLAIKWGYDVNASAKGSVALGAPGLVTFSGSGKREALYAVIRRFHKDARSLTALSSTAGSWMMPSQVDGLADVAPGTWMVAEADGSVALALGVKYGYDFNWVREATALGLTGDVGLALHLGVSAALNFSASGTFAVVVSRDSQDDAVHALRFRLFRLRKKGWGFAFNANASVQGDVNKFLPAFDDFVKAVFGVHGAQVVKDLKLIEQWTDPKTNVPELFGNAGVELGKRLLEQVTGLDPETAFNQARDRIAAVVKKWDALPHDVATRLWAILEEHDETAEHALGEIREIATQIHDANQDTIRKPLATLLANVDFFQTPAGQWLESAAAGRILAVLDSAPAFEQLQKAAGRTLELLDGDALEQSFVKLQKFIKERLDLTALFTQAHLDDLIGVTSLEDIDQASFDTLDAWLKVRLAAFIDGPLDLAKVNEIRKAIFLFIKRGRGFYDQTVKALNRKYDFSIAATFQGETTGTALLDFTLDGDRPEAFDALKLALAGQYDRLLVERIAGVTLNAASLSHQIARSSRVEINLPWATSAVDHINTSLARVDAVDEDGGRVVIYELAAKDIVTERNKRDSRLAIGGFLRASDGGVRVHSTELTYEYTLRQVQRRMKRADLQYQLKPYVDTYFQNVFEARPEGGSFENWIGDLDNHIDALENNGTDNFGDTLLSVQLTLPASAVSAWKDAPGKPVDDRTLPEYLAMSRRIQATMRRIIPLVYFQDLSNFDKFLLAAPLLVYAAMPPSTGARLQGNTFAIDTNDDYHWNWPDEAMRHQMALHPRTTAMLAGTLARVHHVLHEAGRDGAASFYTPARAQLIQQEAASRDTDDLSSIGRLLFVEAQVIDAARASGFAIAKFRETAGSKPSEAVKALAKFGSALTEAFNAKLAGFYGDGALRPLGTELFLEAAAALQPGLTAQPTAMLEVAVLKRTSTFPMGDYLKGTKPPAGDVLVQQRVLNVV